MKDLERRVCEVVQATPALRPAKQRPPRGEPLDIIIPVFNNATLLEQCLEALLPTLSDGDVVWLVDDASHEPGVAAAFARFQAAWPETRCLENARNLGFVRNSNLAIEQSAFEGRRDVVLLNSDTQVASGWLEYLQDCLGRNPQAGIVCPLSDRASILSVTPSHDPGSREALARLLAEDTIGDVSLPTAVGFCMLMRRQMLECIGPFSLAFSPGYGEENDLSMRALSAGWEILAADRACVFHHSGGSFGDAQRSRLQREHGARLERLWPEYKPLVQSWWRDNPLRVRSEQLAHQGDPRPGVLHVLHRQYHVGGTERVARTLVNALAADYRQTLIYPGETNGAWCDMEVRGEGAFRELMVNKRWIRPGVVIGGHGADLACPQSERALARIIEGMRPAVVHFHHLLHWDSLLAPALAQAMGCRVVISIHDFWFNCPIHNQLEHSTGQPCQRPRAVADDRCGRCLAGYGLDSPRASAYIEARAALVKSVLQRADAVIVPSHFIRRKIEAGFGLEGASHIHVLAHGVAVPKQSTLPGNDDSKRTLVLGYFGGDQVLKGGGLVLQLARALAQRDVVIRVHGRIKGFDPKSVPPNVELRGFYNPDDVGQVLRDIDLALLPSYYEESFSMIASECWAHGVPVLSGTRGAMAERVIEGVNGWTVGDMSVTGWLMKIHEILDGRLLADCRQALASFEVTSIEQSTAALDAVYRSVLDDAKPAQPSSEPSHGNPRPAHFDKRLQILREEGKRATGRDPRRVLGVIRDHWGTPAYRVRLPLQSLQASGQCDAVAFQVVRDSGFEIDQAIERLGAGRVVVQPFLSDPGLQLMERLHREAGVQTTLVIDDLWTDMRPGNPALASAPPDIAGRLAYAVSLSHAVVLTTPALQRCLALEHDNIHVINNALAAECWNVAGYRDAATLRAAGRRLRIGWVGAPQHGEDLEFLQPVIEATVDLADWVFLGMCPQILRSLAFEVHDMVPFEDYPGALAELGLDLGIAPLADHAFNRCKSHLKVLEYGILGIPVVATELEPYLHCPVPLAKPGDVADWVSKIRALLEHDQQRLALADSLRQWVRAEHLLPNRQRQWASALGLNTGPQGKEHHEC